MNIALLTFVLTLTALFIGYRLRMWQTRTRTPLEVAKTDKRCDYHGCDQALPKGAIRTHHGHWRCMAHKVSV